MEGIALFNHAGSGNHGCEAIVRGFLEGVKENAPAIRLLTNSGGEDRRYLGPVIAERLSIEEERHLDRDLVMHTLLYGYRKLTGDKECYLRYRFPMLFHNGRNGASAGNGGSGAGLPALAISIGGDNYCYPEMVPELILADRMLADRGVPTALLGCSIEPDALAGDKAMVEDLKGHRLITVRESLTYEALCEAGIPEERLRKLPDPAFAMPAAEGGLAGNVMSAADGLTGNDLTMADGSIGSTMPAAGQDSGIVGINVSPLIERYRGEGGETALDAFTALTEHLIQHTDLRIRFVPHVVWANSDDRKPLRALQERFAECGRTELVADAPAPVLKREIAGCQFFVGARTHATIAAYSSLVPTLVVGYSVKSRGIARDLFGEDRGLVLPVQELTGAGLIAAFEDLRAREKELRGILSQKIPGYRERARENAAEMLACVGR